MLCGVMVIALPSSMLGSKFEMKYQEYMIKMQAKAHVKKAIKSEKERKFKEKQKVQADKMISIFKETKLGEIVGRTSLDIWKKRTSTDESVTTTRDNAKQKSEQGKPVSQQLHQQPIEKKRKHARSNPERLVTHVTDPLTKNNQIPYSLITSPTQPVTPTRATIKSASSPMSISPNRFIPPKKILIRLSITATDGDTNEPIQLLKQVIIAKKPSQSLSQFLKQQVKLQLERIPVQERNTTRNIKWIQQQETLFVTSDGYDIQETSAITIEELADTKNQLSLEVLIGGGGCLINPL
jgi:hypothetical protein